MTSTYMYGRSADRSYHRARLTPLMNGEQQVQSAKLVVNPSPTGQGIRSDFFNNPVDWFVIEEAHDRLELTMQAEVQIARQPNFLSTPLSWNEVAQASRQSRSLGPESPAHFVRPTPYTVATTPLRLYGTQMFAPGAEIKDAAMSLCQALFETMRYDGQATTVATTATQAFDKGAGVCQDFAHIMIAVCRSAGVPARYVSGYIRTIPPPGQKRLEGADAMHAWVSVWMGPDLGWVDFDPTNGVQVSDDHITVAFGRDYFDTAPVRGEVVGGGEQAHEVAVDVIELA